jgi:hypothetical protein
MNKALIITPTGCEPFFDDEFDKENHWTFRKPDRSFDVEAVIFNDYSPLPEQFDRRQYIKGRKWAMLPYVASSIYWEDYDYIGYWDDDYCTDIQSVELALKVARENDMRMFQQSLTSWTVYPILTHNPQFIWAETNFIELGVPFFRNDIFRKVLRFFQDYTPGEAEWGMDKVMCFYLQQTAHVIHASKVKHMRRESYYDKTKAFAEMDYLMKDWFPKYMKEKFNLDYEYSDNQVAFRAAQIYKGE